MTAAMKTQMATTGQPPVGEAVAMGASRRNPWVRRGIVLLAILIVLVAVYFWAWLNAFNLSNQYVQDADASYNKGSYLNALVGYEEFDPNTNKYVTHGGYFQVQTIWEDPYAWPKPADTDRASQRINEIINQKMTVQQAEQFVQANMGKNNPYFGVIYLRLGELYAQKGDKKDATDVFQTVIQSFSGEPDLVDKAKQDLAKLGK